VFTGESFCEACGRALTGAREHGGRPDDHVEIETPFAGGVTDRGRRHHRNEDAMALRVLDGGDVAAVVCDGVSTSARPEDAARSAADTGVAVLAERLAAGAEPATASHDALLRAAAAVAALAAAAADQGGGAAADQGDAEAGATGGAAPAVGQAISADAPACTYVSVLVTPPGSAARAGAVTVGWIGDSRAYWLADGGGRRLTMDDTWTGDMVASGALTEAEGRAHPNAHVLTAWLGADAGTVEPHVATFTPDGPGSVIVCSDGLWNYLPEPADIAAALPAADPLTAARALVRIALEAGGRDNITVVVIPVPLNRPENAE
jgi:serine/threonine protein phosphatase PrpC